MATLLGTPHDTDQSVRAGLQEIFSSIQGEGPYVGMSQIFVRFNACHLKCAYCDTPQRPAARQCEIEAKPGTGVKTELPNPLSVEQVMEWIRHFHQLRRHHSISFTGGEPLLYTEFLKVLLPQVRELLPVYLETSGTQPEKLQDILPLVDIVAMDIKLPSATGEPMLLDAHKAFYEIGRKTEMFVKLVFSETTPREEIEAAASVVTDRWRPIILQPMTDLLTGENTVSARKIFEVADWLSPNFDDVRVISPNP